MLGILIRYSTQIWLAQGVYASVVTAPVAAAVAPAVADPAPVFVLIVCSSASQTLAGQAISRPRV